jgi:hypothetical protein
MNNLDIFLSICIGAVIMMGIFVAIGTAERNGMANQYCKQKGLELVNYALRTPAWNGFKWIDCKASEVITTDTHTFNFGDE